MINDSIWYFDIFEPVTGGVKVNAFQSITTQYIKAKTKPTMIIIDGWLATPDLLSRFDHHAIPVVGVKVKQIIPG